MQAGEIIGHNCSIECHNVLYGSPTEEETAHHIVQSTKADERIVLLYLLCSCVRSIVAYLLYRTHVALKLPIFIDEGIYLWVFQHFVQCLSWFERHIRHVQVVSYQPFQCLACIAGTFFWKGLLKDFCLIAVCV